MKKQLQIKDRVKLINGHPNVKGTIVKVFFHSKGRGLRTCGVLWDNDWPRPGRQYNPRVAYVKPEELEYVDTWRLF
jgi:hypothetical protein